MKSAVSSFVVLSALLLPCAAAAQTNAAATTRQLPSESLAVLTPANTAPAPAERVSRVYTGTVLNEKGQPLAGALVAIGPNKDQLTVTNAEGIYLLRSDNATPRLRVTYAGYEDAEASLSTPQPVTFNLAPVDHYKRQLKQQGKAAEKAFYNK